MRVRSFAACLLLSACNTGASGGSSSESRSYPVAGFDGVVLAGPYDVIVAQGPTPGVRAEGDAEALDRLEIRVEGDDLWIGSKDRLGFGMNGHRSARIFVTAPRLHRARIDGAGDLRIDKVTTESFRGVISGSGDLRIGDLQTRGADLSIAGSGDLSAAGRSGHTTLSIAGSGDIDAGKLVSRTVAISIAGAGDISAHASEDAKVSIMGSGDVAISGTNRCSVHKLGSGSVRCLG